MQGISNMITVTGDAKITMGGQDVTEIVTDKDTVSIEGLGSKISVCEHEHNGQMLLSYPGKYHCIKCGEFYR